MTLPKYMTRELGEDALYGTITAINPLMIIIIVPLMGPIAKYFNGYN